MGDFKDFKNLPEETRDDVQYFCKFTFGQFFTILVLEIVTLAFMFYLGAKYGNEYLKVGEQIAVTQPQIEVVSNVPQQSVLQDTELQAMAKDALQGKPDLKQRVKELLEKQGTPPVVETPVTEAPPVETPPAETLQAETPPAEIAQALPKTEGVIQMKAPASSQFSIQVGSYPNMDEANLKISDWREKGYPAYIMIADIADRGRWYRVRIGGFATKDDAQKYLDQFVEKENSEAIIVRNE